MQEQNKHRWTPEEENRLIELNSLGNMSDREIGEQLGNLTKRQVYDKKRELFSADGKVAKRERFTAEEDEKLKKYCPMFKKTNGDIDWSEVAKHIPGRTMRQCRDRWYNCISPNFTKNNEPWTTEENEIIISNIINFGVSTRTFKSIQQKLPYRSQNSIRNHYYKLLGLLSPKRKNELPLNQTEALGNSINDIDTQLTNEQEQNNNQNQNDNRNDFYFSLNGEQEQSESEDFFSFSAILDQMAADEEKNDDFPYFYNFDY